MGGGPGHMPPRPSTSSSAVSWSPALAESADWQAAPSAVADGGAGSLTKGNGARRSSTHRAVASTGSFRGNPRNSGPPSAPNSTPSLSRGQPSRPSPFTAQPRPLPRGGVSSQNWSNSGPASATARLAQSTVPVSSSSVPPTYPATQVPTKSISVATAPYSA